MDDSSGLSLLARYGRFVHRRRWLVLLVSVGLLAVSVLGVAYGASPNFSGSPGDTESAAAGRLISDELPRGGSSSSSSSSSSSFELLYLAGALRVDDPAFRSALERSLDRLRRDHRVTGLSTPYSEPEPAGSGLRSSDGHKALVVVDYTDSRGRAPSIYPELRAEVGPAQPLQVSATGDAPLNEAFSDQLSRDLSMAGRVSLPVTAVLLLLVFGTLVAAMLPLCVGSLAVLGGLGGLFFLSRFADVSQYATELVFLIGLGVGIDYSLFIVSRYREQLARGSEPREALALAMATSGRSVIFSGLTVAVGLSGLMFYQGSFLASLGLGGTFAVISAVLYALTLLPAVLALSGRGVNRLRLPVSGRGPGGGGMWRALSLQVMRRPLLALIPALALLVLLAWPALHIQLGGGGIKQLPPGQPARHALDQINAGFPHRNQETIPVVLDFRSGSPSAAGRAAYATTLSAEISTLPGVLSVDNQTGSHLVELLVRSSDQPNTGPARSLVAAVRALPGPKGGRKLVTGETASVEDDVGWILGHTPAAAIFVIVTTYLLLLALTGSVLLPLKAVLANLVSVGAAFGVLTWIFQDGNAARLLDFTPQTLDPSVAVLILCILFGLSMDYEVLMLSRIQEEWRRTRDTRQAVALGLERTGRLITGAAAIMVGVFLSFALGGVVFIKAFGLGLAVAVAIDATVVRGAVVPSVMCLLGRLNWWAPAPVAGFRLKLGFDANAAYLDQREPAQREIA